MKQATKIILFAAIIAIVFGSVIIAVGYFSSDGPIGILYSKEHGWQRSSFPGSRETFIIEQSVDNLNLNVSLGEIRIIPTDDPKISVEYRVSPLTKHSVDGTTLTVTQLKKMGITGGMQWDFFRTADDNDYKVNVYIPLGTKFASVMVDSGLGSLTIEELKSDKLNAIVGLGSVAIKNSDFGELDIDADQGSCTLKNVTAAVSGKMELGLGSLNLSTTVLTNPTIRLGLGSFNSKDSSYTGLHLQNDLGSITMVRDSLYGAIEMKSDLGSIDLKLMGARKQYIITTTVDLGSARGGDGNPETAENTIDLASNLGSINVRFDD